MRSETCDQAILSITLFLIVFAPLAFGAVESWTLNVIRVSVLLMLVLGSVQWTFQRHLRLARPPLVTAFLLFVSLTLFQVVPLPTPLREFFSSGSKDTPTSSGTISEKQSHHAWAPLSVAPEATREGVVDFLMYSAFTLVLLNSLQVKKRLMTLLAALVGVGCFEATYGLLEYWSGRQHIFWYPKVFYRQEVTGTYINHNHFAGLLELVLPLAVGLLCSEFQFPQKAGQRRSHQLFSPAGLKSMGLLLSIAVMVIALVLSKSRAGIVASVLSLIVLAYFLGQKRARIPRGLLLGIFTVLLIGVITLRLNWDVVERFGWTPYEARIRAGLWKDSAKIVVDHPILGSGLGTFKYIIPRYRTKVDFLKVPGGSQPATWFHTHNDYLQLLVECGFAGFLLVLWTLVVTFWRLHTKYRSSLACVDSILGYSLLMGMFALLLHSFIDFNFHIPANALIFCLLLSSALVLADESALAQPASERTPEKRLEARA